MLSSIIKSSSHPELVKRIQSGRANEPHGKDSVLIIDIPAEDLVPRTAAIIGNKAIYHKGGSLLSFIIMVCACMTVVSHIEQLICQHCALASDLQIPALLDN